MADDDEAIVDSTILMLEMMGYETRFTLDGAVMEKAIAFKPNLILLDIWMSGIDGRDICRSLKADQATRAIPVLMISASRENRDSALTCGASDFMEKPFEMDALVAKIEQLTGTS